MRLSRLSILIVFLFTFAHLGKADDTPYIFAKVSVLCEGLPVETMPAFNEVSCRKATSYELDPQGRTVWAKATITLPAETLSAGKPLGLFISGKAASRFYLNGVFLGANGTPGASAETETPGVIDTVLPIPEGILKAGRNDLVMVMSAHGGFLTLRQPISVLALGPFTNPTGIALNNYLPSIPAFGILLIGTFFFGLLAFRHTGTPQRWLLPLAALFATLQMAAEFSRGLIAYSYPFHDLRLMLIILFALGSGGCLLFHVVGRFTHSRRVDVILGGMGLTVAMAVAATSYDDKAAFAIMTPAAVGALISMVAAFRKQKHAAAYTVALAACAIGIYATTSDFLDVYFYYLVAALLAFLLAQQIAAFSDARKKQQEDEARTAALEEALQQAKKPQAPRTLSVRHAGRVEAIPLDQIIYCKGARDYVELHTTGGKTTLYSGSLAELEDELPETFLKVHRSYIVNRAAIEELTREASGTGVITFQNGATAPVSRRNMPSVRKALTA